MTLYSLYDRDLARQAGFEVSEDADQPGLYAWVRREGSRAIEGCDASFSDPDSAWLEAIACTDDRAAQDAGLTQEQWRALSYEQRAFLVREAFPQGPGPGTPLDAQRA